MTRTPRVGAVDMVHLVFNRVITLLGRGGAGWRRTSPSQGVGHQALPCASISGPLSYSHTFFHVMSPSTCGAVMGGNMYMCMGPRMAVVCVRLCSKHCPTACGSHFLAMDLYNISSEKEHHRSRHMVCSHSFGAWGHHPERSPSRGEDRTTRGGGGVPETGLTRPALVFGLFFCPLPFWVRVRASQSVRTWEPTWCDFHPPQTCRG